MLLAILPENIANGALAAAVFGAIGIVMLLVGLLLFELVTRKINVQEELTKGNTAVAIVVAAMLLAIAYVVAHVVS